MIYMAAGAVGVDPGPLTLCELVWMMEGHGKDEWARASNIIAPLWNAVADLTKRKPFVADDFNPYSEPKETLKIDNLGALKAAFTKK